MSSRGTKRSVYYSLTMLFLVNNKQIISFRCTDTSVEEAQITSSVIEQDVKADLITKLKNNDDEGDVE